MQEPQETWVHSLGQEDPLEGGMATHASILAWRIPWTEEPGGCSPGHKKSNVTEANEHTCIRVFVCMCTNVCVYVCDRVDICRTIKYSEC